MKKICFVLAMAAILVTATTGFAQTPRGFWNIEISPRVHNYTIVRYYAADKRLIGEERVARAWVDIRRRRIIKKLDRKLREYEMADSLNRVAQLGKK